MHIFAENNGILFQNMEPIDIEQTAICLSQALSTFEPMTKTLKISFDEVQGLSVPVCKKAVEDGLSVIAKDRETGEVVGAIISENFQNMISLDSLEYLTYKFDPLFSLLSKLDENYHSDYPVKVGQVLHIFMLVVSHKYNNKNIAKILVRENLKLAKVHHFKDAIAEATGTVSQHIFRSLGFAEEFAIDYNSYEFKGEKVFDSIEHPPSCLLMSSPI